MGAETHFEISHPIDSADDLNDFSLSFGDTVGFAVQYAVFGPSGPVFTRPAGEFGPMMSDIVVLTADVTPPALSVVASPSLLWPPNRQLQPVTMLVEASDASGIAQVTLVSVTSSDEGAAEDIAGASVGTDDRSLLLRAERSGAGAGRTYTVTYRATDLAGNETLASETVTVPHDLRSVMR